MGKDSGIEWTDHTWNPWRGCSHAVLADGSEHAGCLNCYAETMAKRNPKVLGQWGREDDGGTRVLAAHDTFHAPLKWNASAEQRGVRERVFLDSMHDLFEEWDGAVLSHDSRIMYRWPNGDMIRLTADEAKSPPFIPGNRSATLARPATMTDVRREVFAVIDQCPALDFLVLTKRPGNISGMMYPRETGFAHRQNVWLGTSISNQQTADELVPQLLKSRLLAPVLFLSCEPLLGPINLWQCMAVDESVDWVIVGGESGHHRRQFDPEWARDILAQCQNDDIPFFGKQWDKVRELPYDLMVRQFPKGAWTCGQS